MRRLSDLTDCSPRNDSRAFLLSVFGETALAILAIVGWLGMVSATGPPDLISSVYAAVAGAGTEAPDPRKLEPALRGRVVCARGQALAGARIEARPLSPIEAGMLREQKPDDDTKAEIPETEGGSDGRFELRGLIPGRDYRLVASLAGHATGSLTIPAFAAGREPREVEIVLSPGILGFGAVLDLDEQPIAGARVRLLAHRGESSPWEMPWSEASKVAIAGADGRFELLDLAAGRYVLAARADGYRELTVPGIEVAGRGVAFDLGSVLLEPDRPLAVKVTDPDGEPIADAVITWLRLDRGGTLKPPADDEARGLTGNDGGLSVEGLPKNARLALEISREGYRTRRLSDVYAGADPLVVILEPGVSVSGIVVDPTGLPVVDAVVELVRSATSVGRRSTGTDAEGRFELSGLAAGGATLAAGSEAGCSRPLELELELGSVEDVRLELRVGATVSGRVIDARGLAVVGAVIEAEPYRPGIVAERRRCSTAGEWRTSEEGWFTVAGLEPGRHRFSAAHPDFVPVAEVVRVVPGAGAVIELELVERRLQEKLRLFGRILDPAGAGVLGAAVTLVSPRGTTAARAMSDGSGDFAMASSRCAACSASMGPAKHTLEVRHPRFAAYRSEPFELGVETSEERVVELEEGGSIAGEIHGLELDELTELRVSATRQGLSLPGQVGYDSRYRIAGLAIGEWFVHAQLGPRSVSRSVNLASSGAQETFDLAFEAGFVLSGVVRLEDEALAEARIDASCLQPRFHASRVTDDFGRFEFREVPEGDCTLTANAATDAALAQRGVEVRGDTEIEIRIAAAALSGRLLSLGDRAPVSGATVELTYADAAGPASRVETLSDARGRFALAAAGRGSYRVRVAREGFALLERQLQLDRPRELELLLQPAETAVLYVVDPEGAVPPRIRLEISNGAGSAFLVQSHQPEIDGKVTVRSLPPGFWSLSVVGPGGAMSRALLEVPGEPKQLVLGARVSSP